MRSILRLISYPDLTQFYTGRGRSGYEIILRLTKLAFLRARATLASNNTALCRIANLALNFVFIPTSSDVWHRHHYIYLEIRQERTSRFYLRVERTPAFKASFLNSEDRIKLNRLLNFVTTI